MELDGRDLRRDSWETRRDARVRLLHGESDGLQLSGHLQGEHGPKFYRACRLDLKGIIPYTVEEDMFWELIESVGFPAPEAAGEN